MRAVIIDEPKKMRVGDWTDPSPGRGEVLVKIKATGVCAGDLYYYLGKNPYAFYPQVCGHEIAGSIYGVGEDVSGLEIGAPVVVEPFINCGHCYPCKIGKGNCCRNLQIIGVHKPGGFGEFVSAPARLVHPIPESMSYATASFAEPVAIGVQASRRGKIGPDDDVLILGCGPIGLALIEVVRSKGANVIATDLRKSKIKVAQSLGVDVVLGDEGLSDYINKRTNDEGMPVVIEAAGSPLAMQKAVELVAPGGRVIIVGLLNQGVTVEFPGLDLTRKEMTVLGSRASVNCFPEAIELLSTGAISYPSLSTQFSMWDAPEVLKDIVSNPDYVEKAVLVMDK
jgi:threonine dehydrogenase-like Zn-dependent dehydrogenase